MPHAPFFEERQPAAVLKHEILRRYLPVFARKAGSTSKGRRIAFVDGYAGPGIYEDGSPGSPAIAVETARMVNSSDADDRIDGYFIESDAATCKELRAYLATEGRDWRVFHGNVQEVLPDVLASIDPATALLAFLDPFGLGIPLQMLESEILARGGRMTARHHRVGGAATEVLLNFSLPGLRRNAGHLLSTASHPVYRRSRVTLVERVDAAMGGTWWQELWIAGAPGDRERLILEGYEDRLAAIPGGWGGHRVPVADKWEGPPDYHLLLMTQHPDGMWHFHEALSNALEPYREACFSVSGQMDFEPLEEREKAWVAEITTNIERMLTERRRFVVGDEFVEVYGEALGFAREKHIRRAIKALHNAGRTPTTGVGDVKTMVVRRPA